MPRLKDPVTGSVVNVDEATAKQLVGFVPVQEPAKKAPAKPEPKK